MLVILFYLKHFKFIYSINETCLVLFLAGEEWREMDDSEKMPYEKKSQEGQKVYEVAMANFRKVCVILFP